MEVEVPTAGSSSQPTALADAELDVWAGIWQHHRLREVDLPAGAENWDDLEPVTVAKLREVLYTFPAKSA
eukprot:6805095-Pyramimonas_sp.AAC.1